MENIENLLYIVYNIKVEKVSERKQCMSRKRWNLGKLNKELAANIAEQYSIDPFAALLLSQRCFSVGEEIEEFISPEMNLCDPFLLPDMQAAVDRINDAIFDYEKICVYGDYDADGVTATALLYSYLEAQGANVTYMLPDRERDGYGLSRGVVDRIHGLGTNLIVTVDNGIAAVEEAEYIKELGMELVVTDHHLPGAVLPDCVAVVDPHRTDCQCPYEDFAGVGVAFKLACAIEGDSDSVIYDFAHLVAIGTVADIVPLTGENRTLVRQGLQSLNTFKTPGIEALVDVCGLGGKTIMSSNISFGLAPRINAAGRMGSAEKALELLLCEEPLAASEIASELDAMNTERHKSEGEILAECEAYIAAHPEVVHNPVLVLRGENWHEGVLGIVASKILERYLRPAIVLTTKGEITKGSARSIEGFSMFDALTACADHLSIYGGHDQAAGLTLPTENISAFIESINEYAYSLDNIGDVYPEIYIDCKLNAETLSTDLLDSLAVLEPFGAENPSPVFGLFDMVIDNLEFIGDKKQHLRITAHKNGKQRPVTMMKFNAPKDAFAYRIGDTIDVAVTMDKNEWNGMVRLSVIVKDIRPAGASDDDMVRSEKTYDLIALRRPLNAEQASYAMPDRLFVGEVYRYLKILQSNTGDDADLCSLADLERILSIVSLSFPDANLCRVRVAIEALLEHSLISITDSGKIRVEPTSAKVDLFTAPTLEFIAEFLVK